MAKLSIKDWNKAYFRVRHNRGCAGTIAPNYIDLIDALTACGFEITPIHDLHIVSQPCDETRFQKDSAATLEIQE